ncbi:MAG: ABC transporter permease subunit [Nitrospiraceae bacterium]|nr:ABC transporter permease subunit [Nitrospiraceae bacterium]
MKANRPMANPARRMGGAVLPFLVHGVLLALAAIMLAPLFWLVCAAFKSPEDLFHYTFASPHPTLHNWRVLFEKEPVFRYVANSLFVSSALTLLQLLTASLAGFALAKYEFWGKRPLMTVMLATMMIPGQVLLAPTYKLINHMGLIDTYWALLLPGAVSVFGIILFRQSILQVPDDLLDAGRIDGCSEFRIYWEIILPVSRPMVGAFTLIAFMGAWNSFLWPQIVLQSRHLFTLPIALNNMVDLYSQEYGALMAGTLLSILPVAFLFALLQKEFLAGLTSGAVKG